MQQLCDFDAEAGSYAVHIARTVEAEAALQIRHVNAVINGQIKADMANFLRSGFGSAWNPAMIDQSETGPEAPPFSNAKMIAAAGLAEWTKTSGWARDTGGEIDPVTGAPVRAQDGVLKDLWGEVLAEEQQRAELLAMFPDLQLSPEAARGDSVRPSDPPRAGQQEDAGTGTGAHESGGEWQGVLSNLAAEISMDMSAQFEQQQQQQGVSSVCLSVSVSLSVSQFLFFLRRLAWEWKARGGRCGGGWARNCSESGGRNGRSSRRMLSSECPSVSQRGSVCVCVCVCARARACARVRGR
eukprot:COSAG03_NODE_208_length_10612_cov_35.757158_4_plen_298_part_00